MMRVVRTCLTVFLTISVVVGCATHRPAPVSDRGLSSQPAPPAAAKPADRGPETYTVKPGETLYRIAFEHGLDYRELAAWNGLDSGFAIRPGQVLRIRPPGDDARNGTAGDAAVVTAPLRTAPPVGDARPAPLPTLPPSAANTGSFKASPKAVKLPYSDQAYGRLVQSDAPPAIPPPTVAMAAPPGATPSPAAPPVASEGPDEDRVDWAWPTSGKVIANFNENANLKGVDIGGKPGQPVTASAAGKVVYADSGLRGYGKLVVIKHNKTYISAYAHNSKILVKEGQHVAKGQKIAEMGNTDTDTVKLHFEIRHLGKPIDPLKYLPPA
jgi:lipoprotein NlpD